ncbi:MAG: alpha/beta hydrolase [Rhodospirillales bacterium]|jgi:phospholipase/carboxylesterase
MNTIPSLVGPEFGPTDNNSDVKQLVILVHGLGADGSDLIGLAPYFSKVLPKARFLSPNAPELCDMAPPGMQSGLQWFSLQQREEADMLAGARSAEPTLNKFIDEQLEKYNLTEKELALIGFSQGTMLSLFIAPRRAKTMAGIVGFSGRLIGKEELANEITSHPPVVLINGDQDELVPINQQPIAAEILKASGITVHAHIRPGLGHSIDADGIQIACEFLKQIFK